MPNEVIPPVVSLWKGLGILLVVTVAAGFLSYLLF